MPGCIVSATTASFRSVEKRRLRATPVITSTFENVSDIGVCLGLSLGPPAIAGVRSKQGAVQRWAREFVTLFATELDIFACVIKHPKFSIEAERRITTLLRAGEHGLLEFRQKRTLL